MFSNKLSWIITGAAQLVGLATTVYFTYKSTMKYAEYKEEVDELPTPIGRTAVRTKIFGKAIFAGLLTAGLTSMVAVRGCKQSVLMDKLCAASMLTATGFQNYRKEVKKRYGEETEEEIYRISINDAEEGIYQFSKEGVSLDEPCVFYEEEFTPCDTSPPYYKNKEEKVRYFKSTLGDILDSKYKINRNYALGTDVTLNAFYEFIGIEKTDVGEEYGWTMSGDSIWYHIDISMCEKGTTEDGYKIYKIIYQTPPENLSEIYEYCQ